MDGTGNSNGNHHNENSDVDDVEDNYFYELLGAPLLLYRNREMYTIQDEDATIWNYQKKGGYGRSVQTKYIQPPPPKPPPPNATTVTSAKNDATSTTDVPSRRRRLRRLPATTTATMSASMHAVSTNAAYIFCQDISKLHRLQARWYYPMDFHLIPKYHHSKLPMGIQQLCRKWSKQLQLQQQQGEVGTTKRNATTTPSFHDIELIEIADDDDDDDDDDEEEEEEEDVLNFDDEELPPTDIHEEDADLEYLKVMKDLQDALNRRNNNSDRQQSTEEYRPLPQRQPQQQQPESRNAIHEGNHDDNTTTDSDADESGNAQSSVNTTTTTNHYTATKRSIVDPQQLPPIKERYIAVKQMFRTNEYNASQMFHLQLQARAHMLLGMMKYSDTTTTNLLQQGRRRQHNYHVRQILQATTQLDTNYVPGQDKIKFNYTYDRPKHEGTTTTGNVLRTNHKHKIGINKLLQQQTQLYDRERWNRGTPEYMAPFHIPSVRHAVAHDMQARYILPTKSSLINNNHSNKIISPISYDDPNRPTIMGNCIVTFPCRCDICYPITTSMVSHHDCGDNSNDRSLISPVPCILHPVGPLQDRVRLSFVQLPLHRRIGGHYEPRRNIPEELDVGDRIRQLELCGQDPYIVIVRTDLHCTVLSISFLCPRREIPQQLSDCWGTANIQQLHRIDCRTMWRSVPSFRPIDMACHPKYGIRNTTPCKVAVVYESSMTKMRNIIHHYQITKESYTVQKYDIINLQDVTEIVFANHHPMILYCIGRSYVRPTLTTSYIQKNRPRIGHGHSLYCIDLRQQRSTSSTNENQPGNTWSATYIWSPNIEEYTSEGIYSISGLQTDWTNPYHLWVSSISAGKTYLIDTRLPCECICTFSLPYLCDQPGSHLPPTGLYGAGTLFSRPYHLHNPNTSVVSSSTSTPSTMGSLMMTSVARTPGAFGIHMYHLPTYRPSLQTRSIECMAGPNLSKLGENLSLAKSSIIPLPDVSDKIFTCGLSTLFIPIDTMCHRSYFSEIGIADNNIHNILCIISLTNKGDMYAHLLLQSNADQKYGKAFDDLPLGYSAIPVPMETQNSTRQWNVISVDLSNDFPIPGHTIRSTETHRAATKRPSTIDLSSFMDKEDEEKKRRTRKSRKSADPDLVTSNSFGDIEIQDDEEETRIELPLGDVPRRAMVATSTNSVGLHRLTLPSYLMPQQTTTDQYTEHFLPSIRSNTDNEAIENRVWRSDLTPDTLDNAWNDNV